MKIGGEADAEAVCVLGSLRLNSFYRDRAIGYHCCYGPDSCQDRRQHNSDDSDSQRNVKEGFSIMFYHDSSNVSFVDQFLDLANKFSSRNLKFLYNCPLLQSDSGATSRTETGIFLESSTANSTVHLSIVTYLL